MLIHFLKQHSISVKELSKMTCIPYSTLNDLANGKVDINNVRYGYIKKIAEILKVSTDTLENICASNINNKNYQVRVHNKAYYLILNGADKEIRLCNVNSLSSRYIKDFAQWEYEELTEQKELDDWREKIIY